MNGLTSITTPTKWTDPKDYRKVVTTYLPTYLPLVAGRVMLAAGRHY